MAGRVKGVNFVQFVMPVILLSWHSGMLRSRLMSWLLLDITASHEGRKTFIELVRRVARTITIPFTVGAELPLMRMPPLCWRLERIKSRLTRQYSKLHS
jgi:imidazole glycerol phosphate synthase subunit HisF